MGGTTARAGGVNRLDKTMKYLPVTFSTLTLLLFDNIAFKTESQLSPVWKRTWPCKVKTTKFEKDSTKRDQMNRNSPSLRKYWTFQDCFDGVQNTDFTNFSPNSRSYLIGLASTSLSPTEFRVGVSNLANGRSWVRLLARNTLVFPSLPEESELVNYNFYKVIGSTPS